ncbi:MAG TPA: hypothetical protein VHJ20_23515 [Polyangia bacterium]|nr:hypothetical protein [Polyangia bacterium]
MVAPQACVAVEIAGPVAADAPRAALERRCSEILGVGRCRIVLPESADRGASCWQARVASAGDGAATVELADPSEPARAPVRRDLSFRANDAPAERWATLGLVIAALVTVEEHSAADDAPAIERGQAGGGFAPVIEAPASPPPMNVRGALAASGVAALGALPHAALGARVEATLGGEHLAFVARGTIFPASTRATVGGAGAGGDFELLSFGAGLCGWTERGRWRARLCAGGDVDRTRANGVGVAETNGATAWWETAWLGAGAERRLSSHLALVATIEGAAAFERPTFAIEGAQSTVFSPAPVSVTAALGLAVPLP